MGKGGWSTVACQSWDQKWHTGFVQIYTRAIIVHKGKTKTNGRRRRPGGGALYLASLRVLGSVQTHIIDVSVCEVISGSGEPNVDLAR